MTSGRVLHGCGKGSLQFVIVQADVLIGTVLHQETVGNGSDLHKTKPFVQVTGMDVIFDYRVELQQLKSGFFRLCQAIRNQLFPICLPRTAESTA